MKGSDKKDSNDDVEIEFVDEEEKKETTSLILDDLSSSDVCLSCSELNMIDPNC